MGKKSTKKCDIPISDSKVIIKKDDTFDFSVDLKERNQEDEIEATLSENGFNIIDFIIYDYAPDTLYVSIEAERDITINDLKKIGYELIELILNDSDLDDEMKEKILSKIQ